MTQISPMMDSLEQRPPAPDLRRELARRLLAGAASTRIMPSIPKRSHGCVLSMTMEQRHVWLHAFRSPEYPIYNEPITIRYNGMFDHVAFLRSFDELLMRHEALRTSFSSLDEDPIQIIHDDIRGEFPLVDLTGIPTDAREAQAKEMARADALTPLPLDRAPLFRGRIVKLDENDHRFYLTLHHIIFDGATLQNIVMPELSAIYDAYSRGVDHDLPPPRVQYGDYAAWQQSSDTDYSSQLEYWRTTLSGELPVVQLPTDRKRPLNATSAGDQEVVWIDEDTSEALRNLARKMGVTSYILLLTLFKTMVHRYGDQKDLIIGTVTDTRRHPDLQGMAGYCLNSVALRTRPERTSSFIDYLVQVRDVVARAVENSGASFEQVARTVPAAARQHIFHTMFSMQPPSPPCSEGWRLGQMEIYPEASKFDLYLEVRDQSANGFEARFMYSSDLFDRETIVRMAGHFTTLAKAVLQDATCSLGALPMLTEEEYRSIIVASNGADRAIPNVAISDMVAEACKRDPAGVAILCNDVAWSRAELRERIDAFVVHLRLAGVRSGDTVGLCVTRRPDMAAAPLAIMAAGAAYLPLDPSFPPARLTAIVTDAKPVLIITEKDIATELPGWGIPILLCEAVGPRTAPLPAIGAIDPEAIAYVMYTSGSTGVPKGVEIQHRSAVNLLRSMAREPGFGARDVLFAVTTPTFDISILELFLPLVAGGTVVISTNAEVSDPRLTAEAIVRSRCTVMQATPATWRGLFNSGWTGVPGLKVLCGGEALSRDLSDAILACGMDLWNVYGPTETTIWSSMLHVMPEQPISIGRPIDNTSMRVLDPDGRLQPVNVPGDLHIGGSGLARGYRDAALTRRAFVELPGFPDQRLYRTGDIAMLRRDGTYEWLGRADSQVKIRGYRIDLGDIEAALSSHPEILSAAVKTFEEQPGQHELAAYAVARSPAPSPVALRNYLKTVLPGYMVPRRYVFLDEMPLSSSGKINRKALSEPTAANQMLAPQDPPMGATEIRLAEIWREILCVGDIDANDDFQELGGHSLLAAKLMGRISRIFGKRLPLSTLLQAPTLRKMAAAIDLDASASDTVRVIALRDGALAPIFWIDAVPNFRPGQYRGLVRSLDPDRPVLGLPVDLVRHDDLTGITDLAALASDIADTIERHPSPAPRSLGGWCNGGILALEVASQLYARGTPIDLLILLDAANPTSYRKTSKRMLHQLIQTARLPANQRWPFVRDLVRGYTARFRRRNLFSHGEEDALEELNERFMRLVTAYEPRPYSGRTLLLQPREGRIDYAERWRPILPDLHLAEVLGGHVTMLDPDHVSSLAAAIEDALALLEVREPMRIEA